jgi:hypothetical protein
MSNLQRQADHWETVVRQDYVHTITEERQPWVKGKLFYSMMVSAARSFIYYIERPLYRQAALEQALVVREMAFGFDNDKQDLDKLIASVAQKLIPIGEEAAVVDKPDWITDEEWQQAEHDSTHDEQDNLLRPQLEGFLSGAQYDMPILEESEFDSDKIRNVVRAALNNARYKVQSDFSHNMKQYKKPNSAKWKAIWTNKLYDAKDDLKVTNDFIAKHGLEYDES